MSLEIVTFSAHHAEMTRPTCSLQK